MPRNLPKLRGSLRAPLTLSFISEALSAPKKFKKQFPFDILCVIVAWVAVNSHRDLKSLSLSNHLFLQISSTWLWRTATIDITPNIPFTPNDAKLTTLLKRSSGGKSISNLRVHVNPDPLDVDLAAFRLRLARLLREAYGLKVLSMQDVSENLDLASLLTSNPNGHRFRLTELTYHLRTTPEFWYFLASQPGIHRLVLSSPQRFGSIKEMEPLPQEALPNLQAVLAPLAFLSGLISGRPVIGVSTPSSEDLAVSDLPLLWQAIIGSSARLTSLTIVISSADSFRALFDGLPEHAPSLRFLGVNCASAYNLAWFPAPDVQDLLPLRSLQSLEVIRWQTRTLFGPFSATDLQLVTTRWHPVIYAGPQLKFVQHEFKYQEGELKEHEGYWKRSTVGTNTWKIRHKQFLAPRIHFNDEALDPLALQFL